MTAEKRSMTEKREVATPSNEDMVRQFAFPSGQKRYATDGGGELKVVSLGIAIMLARKLDDARARLAPEDYALRLLDGHAKGLHGEKLLNFARGKVDGER